MGAVYDERYPELTVTWYGVALHTEATVKEELDQYSIERGKRLTMWSEGRDKNWPVFVGRHS